MHNHMSSHTRRAHMIFFAQIKRTFCADSLHMFTFKDVLIYIHVYIYTRMYTYICIHVRMHIPCHHHQNTPMRASHLQSSNIYSYISWAKVWKWQSAVRSAHISQNEDVQCLPIVASRKLPASTRYLCLGWNAHIHSVPGCESGTI